MSKQHGGKRKGAGRKGYGEPTQMMRVPQSVVPTVKAMLANVLEQKQAAMKGETLYRPVEKPEKMARPLFSSVVAAGFPSPADDYIETLLDLNEYFVPHPSSTFFLRAKGDSMHRAGIFDNTILCVDKSLTAKHGDIVIAVVAGEFTVKRLYQKGNRVELHPESDNSHHQPVICHGGENLEIWGVVCGVHNKVR